MLVVNGFHKLLDVCSAKGQWEDGIVYNQTLIQIEPLDEPAHRKMMQFLAHSNRRSAALAHYENFRHLLMDQLGVAPETETTLLFELIQSGELLVPITPQILVEDYHPQEPAFLEEEASSRSEKPLFVARKDELEQLNSYLSDVLIGKGHIVFIIGGAGRGKTALLNEFASRASSEVPELICISGACDAFSGIGDPYLPFREILSVLTGDLETRWRAGDISQIQARRIWKALPDFLQLLLDHGSDLFDVIVNSQTVLESAQSLPEPDYELIQKINRTARAKPTWYQGQESRQLFQQLFSVLRETSSKNPLLLVLDDFQWADNASISLLFHLGRRLLESRIMIACAYRPEEVDLWQRRKAAPSPESPRRI